MKKVMNTWIESAKFNITNQRLANQVRVILRKGWFSDLEILEICGLVNREEYTQKESH